MADAPTIECPNCGKVYRFSPNYAGKTVRCKGCEQPFRFPDSAGDDDAPLELDFADEPAGRDTCENCGSPMQPAAVLCLNCGYDRRTGQVMTTAAETAADEPPPSATFGMGRVDHDALRAEADREAFGKTWLVPIILCSVGIALLAVHTFSLGIKAANAQQQSFAGMFGAQAAPYGIGYAGELAKAHAGVFLLRLPFFVIGIFMTARLFGASYGPLIPALIKLVAICTLVMGVFACLNAGMDIWTGGFGAIGFIFTATIAYAVFFAAAMPMFEMEYVEALVLGLIVYFVPALLASYAIPIIWAMM